MYILLLLLLLFFFFFLSFSSTSFSLFFFLLILDFVYHKNEDSHWCCANFAPPITSPPYRPLALLYPLLIPSVL